ILADRGYKGEIAEEIKRDFEIELEIANTPNGTRGFTPKPLRWVVERTFAWLDGFRRLTRNYEQTEDSAEEMIDFATIKLLTKHI
ncbi:transposase, partial [uncultured Bacteroides sp.]|uniref:transposase n=1 Tax=uncultured Bacteroides sp. TaxID=162156 RepID=UPI0025B6813B